MAGFSNKIVRKEAAPWCLRRPQTSSADPSGAPRSLRNPYPFVFTTTHVLAVLCHLNSHFFFSSQCLLSKKTLAKKMTVLYKLAREQLSKQHHYDFGLRALKSVLVMAGELKRGSADLQEVGH